MLRLPTIEPCPVSFLPCILSILFSSHISFTLYNKHSIVQETVIIKCYNMRKMYRGCTCNTQLAQLWEKTLLCLQPRRSNLTHNKHITILYIHNNHITHIHTYKTTSNNAGGSTRPTTLSSHTTNTLHIQNHRQKCCWRNRIIVDRNDVFADPSQTGEETFYEYKPPQHCNCC